MRWIPLFLFIMFSTVAHAFSLSETLAEAKHLQSSGSDDEAIVYLEKALTAHNNEPRIKVFLGRLYLAKAANIYNPWKKIKYAKIGMKLQDEAVVTEPRNIFIRLERYKDNMYLPIFLKRSEEAFKDIPVLIQLIESVSNDELMREFKIWDSFNQYHPQNPDDVRIRIFLMQIVYYFAGDAYARREDQKTAQAYMEKCSSLGIDMAFGIRAYSWLKERE